MPGKGGLATGVIVAGFGCGALVFNQIQAKLIEPTEDELNAMKEKALPITGDLKGSYACIVIIDSQGYWLYSS